MVLMRQVGEHPHIVTMLGIVKQMPPSLVLEMAEHGALNAYIRALATPPTLSFQLRALTQVAKALCFLEEQRIVHRDIAARNCLVRTDLSVCLADFGMSRLLAVSTE